MELLKPELYFLINKHLAYCSLLYGVPAVHRLSEGSGIFYMRDSMTHPPLTFTI